MRKGTEQITITEEVYIEGADVTLEPGDRLKIVKTYERKSLKETLKTLDNSVRVLSDDDIEEYGDIINTFYLKDEAKYNPSKETVKYLEEMLDREGEIDLSRNKDMYEYISENFYGEFSDGVIDAVAEDYFKRLRGSFIFDMEDDPDSYDSNSYDVSVPRSAVIIRDDGSIRDRKEQYIADYIVENGFSNDVDEIYNRILELCKESADYLIDTMYIEIYDTIDFYEYYKGDRRVLLPCSPVTRPDRLFIPIKKSPRKPEVLLLSW